MIEQKSINGKKTIATIKNGLQFLDKGAIAKMIFWGIFLIVMIYFTIAFIREKTDFNGCTITSDDSDVFASWKVQTIKDGINQGLITSSGYQGDGTHTLINAYIALYKSAGHNLPLINFSLMSFISNQFAPPATDPTTAWTTRSNAIDLAYSYMFITSLIAIIALATQVYVSSKSIFENYRIKKYGLSTKFQTSIANFGIFKTKMYSDFITNLAIVFAFFNFLSTIIVVGYWTLVYSVSWIIKHVDKKKTLVIDDTFSQHRSDLVYLIFVMIFQNIYTIIKAIFLSKWGVNLDLIFSIILPIGTITVIVGLFIKNMLNSKVNSVLNAIKGIEGTVATLRTFSYTNGTDALEDFNFVAILPPMIKKPLTNGKISKNEALELMHQLDNAIKFVEVHYANQPKERQFMLYTLLNNITSIDQIQELEGNTLKLEAAKKTKNKKWFRKQK